MESKLERNILEANKVRRDCYRKVAHVLIFVVLFAIWLISYVFVANFERWRGKSKITVTPTNNNMIYQYLKLLTNRDSVSSVLFNFGWFYYVLFFTFYIFVLIMLANEFTRKAKYLSFPLNFIPNLVLFDDEKRNYGTYLYFGIGQLFASFVCPPMVLFAILGISSLADLMTSQIGMRYGKRRIHWNRDKTWEGNLAGTAIAFIIGIFFIGIIYSIIFAIAFLIFDAITNHPMKISDNLLIPIGLALIFVIIRFSFDLNYTPLILQILS
ncbi:MAG: hypothetical protein GF353_06545 [Candidatus Lokiarchaeota archaeon]|nr:hypothetical protein [Candidatus Lokiarchaeota archaeon]